MSDDNHVQFAADAPERSGCVNFAKIRIPLSVWNSWQRSPSELFATIESLGKLQRRLAEQAQRHQRQMEFIRQMSQQLEAER